jgi:chemotaxis family two-component system response regulator Rcp1
VIPLMELEDKNTFKILLVEDNLADIRLTEQAFTESKIKTILYNVKDGVEAINFLRKSGKYTKVCRPDLILLDLNLPKKNGLEVLKDIKQDEDLKRIPVVVLTISANEEDLIKAYDLHANAFVNKPLEIREFYHLIKSIEEFWFKVVKLANR